VDRNVECLAGQVPQRQLDTGDGLLSRAVRGLADSPVEIEIVLLDRRRIFPDQALTEVLHQTDETPGDAIGAKLAVAGQPRVGADYAEMPGPRRREAVGHHERLDAGDLHLASFLESDRSDGRRGGDFRRVAA